MSIRSEFIAWYFNEFKFDPLYEVMDGMAEDSPWHRELSIGIHTNMVVTEYLSRTASSDQTFSDFITGAFACAFHDVGKPGACEFKWKEERGDYKSFNGHELLSARLWEDWAVRNWKMLSTRFKLEVEDIYRIAWLIEFHKPWGIKNSAKLRNMALTAMTVSQRSIFTNVLEADTWGRLSDDASDKRRKVADWISQFNRRCVDLAHEVTSTFPPGHALSMTDGDDKPQLIVPIGASGSGKSTLFNTLSDYESYSWDALRLEWYSSDYDEAFKMSCDDKKFMSKVNSEFSRLVKTGANIYVDNTNTSAKRRRFFTDQARRAGYHCVAVLMPSELQTVITRQSTRPDKSVPSNAVYRQYFNVQMPQLGEFDEIIVSAGNL
jgi:predicted kinase